MNQLRVRTEFSFLKAYGQLSKLTARLKAIGARAAGLKACGEIGRAHV